ncbi:2'-5' RNA ligase family protein [Natranaerobius thermophilus]|uniref:Phosphoesterase HXTX n=1 Tax=Natranaerobius thermophilus (strain ATCC BAA-1301 / DSM 18059 / JW/NM-WN-LF) TaxID=457570 RepID=B2A621_NATTJ|nr:2'-5' RNA ligase family protein [Natranaerobius thermophilus]ACB85438.1 Phosphoesterase HXTX [Natranaerobius thermophilus JW/NM-WN-LF]
MSMENKLFLVAIPRGRLLSVASSIQRKLNEIFDIYDEKLPPLHVTIDHLTINNQDEYDKAVQIIENICHSKPPFNLQVNGFSFFGPPHKSINLYVEKTTQLQDLSLEIHEALEQEGLSSRPIYNEWEYHISLINTTFALREWSETEFTKAKELVKEWNVNMSCKVEWLELWKPKFQPHLEIEEFFTLGKGEN